MTEIASVGAAMRHDAASDAAGESYLVEVQLEELPLRPPPPEQVQGLTE